MSKNDSTTVYNQIINLFKSFTERTLIDLDDGCPSFLYLMPDLEAFITWMKDKYWYTCVDSEIITPWDDNLKNGWIWFIWYDLDMESYNDYQRWESVQCFNIIFIWYYFRSYNVHKRIKLYFE